ncbi:MAG: hypothetical protein KDC54_24195, partial [Lewinella sp.]|nr:hypothetical protein [Lewinella sp.]
MTEEQRNRFEALLQTGFRISSTKSLEHGLLLYRSNFRAFAVFAMLLPLASTLIGLLPLGLAGFLITSLLVAPVLNAGYYLVADRLARGERPPFATFFDAREHALPLILNNLLAAAILAVVMIPTYLVFQKA